jgi:ribose transport system substrate-binding protein
MQAAISAHPDLIDTFSNQPQTFVPQVKAARDAGIMVADSHSYSTTEGLSNQASLGSLALPESLTKLGVLFPNAPYYLAGQLEADAAIVDTNGAANVLVITVREASIAAPMEAGILDEFARYAPQSKVKIVNVPTPTWTTGMQTVVQAAVAADPELNYIIALVDAMTPGIIAALEATQSTDRIHIATFNGTPAFIDEVRQGKIQIDIGENLDLVGYALLDYLMRAVAGLPLPDDPKIPVRVFDASNVGEAGNPAVASQGYGDAYKAAYTSLWMLDK